MNEVTKADGRTENLIAAVAEGSTDALASLYRETQSAVFGFAMSMLRDKHAAEDVMQEVYIKIFRSARDYTPLGKPMAWVLTITRNLALTAIRQRREHEDLDNIYDLGVPETGYEKCEGRSVLEAAMAILTPAERQIIVLHAVSGLRHREIAEILNLNPSTVISKYNRALAKLKDEMQEDKS